MDGCRVLRDCLEGSMDILAFLLYAESGLRLGSAASEKDVCPHLSSEFGSQGLRYALCLIVSA